ncbi:MAG: HEPN domain-containing protein [Planctomycetaceae bacterium]|nr:HEPN domain-containing protein [Planctomycetaceae bacterium]
MKTPQEIEILAWERLDEAKVLYENQKYDGAFYLAGYAVELMLKAKIASRFGITGLFDDSDPMSNTIEGIGDVRRAVKTHNLRVLMIFSCLREEFETECETNAEFSFFADMLLGGWSEQSRYKTLGSTNREILKEILDILENKTQGILQWIKMK